MSDTSALETHPRIIDKTTVSLHPHYDGSNNSAVKKLLDVIVDIIVDEFVDIAKKNPNEFVDRGDPS